ncbi:hypothetical protein KSP40_PGU013839 [Platanthera guangdongensis]|uniref:Uncharacterized protein n=1 Tax=Platanthera guangdongensis TaxID=2320717 RepID=A0ABR2MCR3_9ASPA
MWKHAVSRSLHKSLRSLAWHGSKKELTSPPGRIRQDDQLASCAPEFIRLPSLSSLAFHGVSGRGSWQVVFGYKLLPVPHVWPFDDNVEAVALYLPLGGANSSKILPRALASKTIEDYKDWQFQPAGSTATASGRRSGRRRRRRGRGIAKCGGGDSWAGC